MKIQLDFDNKTISLPDDVNLGEFIDNLSKILPEERWRSWRVINPYAISKIFNPLPSLPTYTSPSTYPTISPFGTTISNDLSLSSKID